MSFLKKLFGKTPDEKTLRARAPRVSVTPLHRLSFVASWKKDLELNNISTGGMAICRDDHEGVWQKDGVVSGLLKVDRDEFPVSARVRHVTQLIAGCEFVDPPAGLTHAIEAYLRVEILALNLRKVDPGYMKKDARGEALWFTDGRQNELFCVVDASGLVAYHVSFLGNYFEGGRDKKVKGGLINEDAEESRQHKGSALIDMNRALSPEMVRLAKSFVQNVEQLPLAVRESIAAHLEAGT